MPMTLLTNDGATAVNRPITANPAKAAVAARTNVARTSVGTDSRWKPIRPVRLDVSGTSHTATIASTASTMWTRNGSCNGCGAYCTSRPATTGPAPSPPMLATVAPAAACSRRSSGTDSTTAAVAVPVKMPADNPDSSRPTSSNGTLSA